MKEHTTISGLAGNAPQADDPRLLEQRICEVRRGGLPRHIAVIMDGNGRWARARGLDRSVGHNEGVKSVRRVTEICSELGIGYLTLYTFSTENWKRPKEEVDALMHLFSMVLIREVPDLIKNNVSLNIIGDIDKMPAEARDNLRKGMEATAHCTGLVLTLALSYSSRWELTEVARRIASEVKEGTLSPEEICEDTLARRLATAPMPDPDLLIRTGGELRISNYLLWQIAYSELYFTDILWPDFGKLQLLDAILDFQSRERRFGKTSDQLTNNSSKN